MGQIKSFPSRTENFPFFSITFGKRSINIVDVPPNVIDIIRKCVDIHYCEEIKFECSGVTNYSRKMEVKEHPFLRNEPREYTVCTKRLLCLLLEELYHCGWKIAVDSNFSIAEDVSTLFFERIPYQNSSSSVICLCIKGLTTIQLINAPNEVIAIFEDKVLKSSGQKVGTRFENALEYHFNSCSMKYGSRREMRFQLRRRLLLCIESFHCLNYYYYATAHVNGLTDCIFFIKDTHFHLPKEYCLFSVIDNDYIEMQKAPNNLIEAAISCLEENHALDILRFDDKRGQSWLSFQLGGPWLDYSKKVTDLPRLATRLLQRFRENEWNVITTITLATDKHEKPIFVLRRSISASLPYFAMCPTGIDKIRLVNASREVIEFVRSIVKQNWTIGVQCEGEENYSYCFQLVDMPWNSLGFGQVFELSRMMMSRLLYELNLRGWRVACSVDMAANRAFGRSLNPHAWFLDRVAYSCLNPCFSLPPLPSYEDVVAQRV